MARTAAFSIVIIAAVASALPLLSDCALLILIARSLEFCRSRSRSAYSIATIADVALPPPATPPNPPPAEKP